MSGDALQPATKRDVFGWAGKLRHWPIPRLLIYVVVIVAALILSKLVTMPFIPAAPTPLHSPLLILTNLGSAVFLLCIYGYAVRAVERRGAREIDPRVARFCFFIGLMLGTTLIATIFLTLWSLGFATFHLGASSTGVVGVLAVSFAVAVLEELLLRAVVFRVPLL